MIHKKEIAREPLAQQAMREEFEKLTKAGVWDLNSVRPAAELYAEAKRAGIHYHFLRIFGICTEKNSELVGNDSRKKYKGRYVCQGNQVKDEYMQAAVFENEGSHPASMTAGRIVDFWGGLGDNISQQSDAQQAYIQSKLKSPHPTWVRLPEEYWPEEWIKKGIKNPLVRLVYALYGHPDAGTYWEVRCDTHMCAQGFVPVPECPSTFYHPTHKVVCSVYVDDASMCNVKHMARRELVYAF